MSTAFDLRVKRDALNLLYSNNTGSLIVTLSICTALVFGFTDNPDKLYKIYWFISVCCLLALRFGDMRYWQIKLNGTNYNTAMPMFRFVALRYITAIAMSAYPVIFYQSMDVIELSCTIIVISSMAGGAATVLAANKHLVSTYPSILLIPISILCLLSNEYYQNILGVLGLLFAAVMYSSAKRAYEFTNESLLIKNKHADLLDRIQLKNQEISEANTSLEEKVKERTEQIFELSNIDSLTKLYNRVAFSENLRLLITLAKVNHRKLAILFVDLDGFKGINDSHGHAIGDKVLVEMSNRLSSNAKQKQHVCRWGGDEFLIVLEDGDVNKVREFSKHLIDVLSKPMKIDHHFLNVGATIGISIFPDHASDELQLIALADTAMYVQKQTNKSDVRVFTEEMREKRNRELMIKEGLLQALDLDELFIVYQPVIDSETGAVSFCEALLRWSLNGEVISPAEFIPVAEQHGIINSLGAWVLSESCQQAASWFFDDSVGVSINVSVAQVMRGNMMSDVNKALERSGLPAKNLHLEITESIFAEDVDRVLEQLKALQALGIKVSIDDFGTGFSSLALLQSLSADVVKIDQSFTASIDQGGKAIIQATQYMASELGYTVVAEGVETKAQADELTAMNIEHLQGYYFGKPLTVDALEVWYQDYKANIKG